MSTDHRAMKLGRLPAKRDPRVPEFNRYLTSKLPFTPPVADWSLKVQDWGMLANDRLGDCTAAGVGHFIQTITSNATTEAKITDDDTIRFYSASAGYDPNNPDSDKGAVEADVLSYWFNTDFAGHKLDAYASVDPGNRANVKDAIWLTGGAYLGINLPLSAQDQEIWDVPTEGLKGDGAPNSWGGHCLAPGTRVLTADLRWVPIENLNVGDALIGFDEHIPGKGKRRSYRKSIVESKSIIELPCYDIEFADGTKIRASRDHLWLADDASGLTKWVATEDLNVVAPNGGMYGSRVLKPFEPWEIDNSRDAGYLAAAFDGEGWLSTGGDGRGIHKMGFCQRDNEMFSHVCQALKDRNISFRHRLHYGGFKPETPILNSAGGREDLLRFLGSLRPHRLLPKFDPDTIGTMYCGRIYDEHQEDEPAVNRFELGNGRNGKTLGGQRVPILSITPVGISTVIALGTSTKTYIAEGFASHNCVYAVGYNDKGVTAITWGQPKFMTWEFFNSYTEEAWVLISKEWLRTNGISPSGFDYPSLIRDMAAIGKDPISKIQEATPDDDPILVDLSWHDVTISLHEAAATWALGIIATALAAYGQFDTSSYTTWLGAAGALYATWRNLTRVHRMNVSTQDLVNAAAEVIDILMRKRAR